LRQFAVFAEVLGPSCGHMTRRIACGWAGGGRDTRPIRWCLCVLSLDACSAFSADFIHDLVRRRKPFSGQSTDTVFILAGSSSAMSDELRHKTAVSVAICSQSSNKKRAIKTAWAYRADLLEPI
jgi:5-deoxy-D-glucuronate isomerase